MLLRRCIYERWLIVRSILFGQMGAIQFWIFRRVRRRSVTCPFSYYPYMTLSTTLQRSRMMAGIRGKNTRPELQLRHALFAAGFRYRLHRRDLPGSPDMVFSRYRAALFVHGCFWHRHEGCRYTTTPRSNAEFWRLKFESNVSRDIRDIALLRQGGWRVAIVWECTLKRAPKNVVVNVLEWLQSDQNFLVVE
jgi:DNA mismatch endonuclease (patch repair protein)